jgi:Zn-dependent peptidase ImmA (M78 family)/DNA-binding XRE family transcriptional regulator
MMSKVNYHLITLAREAAGYTQKEFAAALKVEQGTISKIENGLTDKISSDLIERISDLISYPVSFFHQDWMPNRVEGHYRRKLSSSVKLLKENKAKMTLADRHLKMLTVSIELPVPNYPKWNVDIDGSPSLCAQYLREYWKIPKGKINDLTEILEDNGFVIIELDLGEMDGFSALSDENVPLIFLNKSLPGDRYRLTAAHEAFHFIMHHGQKISDDRDVELEAMLGASEFLVPIKEIENQLRGSLSLQKLAELKVYWKMSMQALLTKASKNDLITVNQSAYLWKQISAAGYRTKEPVDIPKEQPTLFRELITTHLEELSYSIEDLGKLLHFNHVNEWYLNKGSRLKILRNS